jgi:hypothetical protein
MIYWLGADFAFAVARPFDGNPRHGEMEPWSVSMSGSATTWHDFTHWQSQMGGTCEGGTQSERPTFSGYVRDLDGNKICLSD